MPKETERGGTIAERWRQKVLGIRSSPPIDYKLIFEATVKNIADRSYSLLDIGTGIGRVIFDYELYKLYGKVVGIDSRKEFIAICKDRADGVRNVEFHQMDAGKTSFKAETFDVVTSMFSPFSPKEVHRLLTRGGYFVLMCNLKGDHNEIEDVFPNLFEQEKHNHIFKSMEETAAELKREGFEISASDQLNYKWIFRDEEVVKQFYEKIFFTTLFDDRRGGLNKLKTLIDGRIPVTRKIGTIVAQKTD